MEEKLARIRAETDQDREHCLEWMRSATPAHLLMVWNEIQSVQADPVKHIVYRLAQLAYCEYFDRLVKEKEKGK